MTKLAKYSFLIFSLATLICCNNEVVKNVDEEKKEAVEIVDKTEFIKENTDPQVREVIAALPDFLQNPDWGRDNLAELRELRFAPPSDFQSETIEMAEKIIEAEGLEVKIVLYALKESTPEAGPGFLWIHGGGYIVGSARQDEIATSIVNTIGGPVVSVEYTLAPEKIAPHAVKECHAALVWMTENAEELNIDPQRIAIGGSSAGAGMAAGLALYNRDVKGPKIAYQLLWQPMLDNLHELPSSRTLGHPIWNRKTSINAWEMYLGGSPGKEATPYGAAMRAEDLSGLPPAYVGIGDLDLFRDECVKYAERLKEAGVATELITYTGVVHGTSVLAGHTDIAKKILEDQMGLLRKHLVR